MKRLACFISTLYLLSACGGSNGPSGPAKTPQERLQDAASATDFTVQIPPNNFTVIENNISNEKQKERYAIGCKNPGEPNRINEMDHQLNVGSVFKVHTGGETLLQSKFDSIMEDKVTAVDALKVNFEKNYEFFSSIGPFTTAEQVFSQRPHSKTEMIYTIDSTGTRSSFENITEMNLTPAAREYLMNNQEEVSTNLVCYLDYNSPQYKNTHQVDKVSYQIAGQIRTAYLVRSISEGADLICEQRTSSASQPNSTKPDFTLNMGPGKQESFSIYSNEVVEKGMYSCGGSELYFSFKISLKNGKIISSYADKILSAPLR